MKLQELMRCLYVPFTMVMLLVLGSEANVQDHKHVLLRASVNISYSPSLKMGTIRIISWRFDKNGKRVLILDTTEKPHYIYDSQFRDRLQLSDDLLTLTLMDLTLEDSAIYTVEVVDGNGNADYYSSNVTVYEPIPLPMIRSDVKENTADRCTVTLHCSVPSHTSDVSYTWQFLESESIYELNINGSSVQMTLKKSPTDVEILCLVQNPADQKKVSIQLPDICVYTGRRFRPLLIIKPAQCVLFMVPLIIYLTIMVNGRKGSQVFSENTNVESHEVTSY